MTVLMWMLPSPTLKKLVSLFFYLSVVFLTMEMKVPVSVDERNENQSFQQLLDFK